MPSARYRVTHETRYTYSHAVLGSRQLAHLTPRSTSWQTVLSHDIDIEPEPRERFVDTDYFGNAVLRFALDVPHESLTVRARSVVRVATQANAWAGASVPWERAADRPAVGEGSPDLEVEHFRGFSPTAPFIEAARTYARPSFARGRSWLEAMTDLTKRIQTDFAYDAKATTVTTCVDEVLKHRRGVCQDFAHLMISCVRSLGMPARYVSGYVLTHSSADSAALTGGDASHAWIASHCPGIGWVAFDPTNGKLADQEFITLGWGREFSDVTPLRGVVLGSAAQTLVVAVRVEPL